MTRGAAASVTVFAGSMVSLDTSGYFRPARASTTDKVIGVNYGDKVVNGSTAGAKNVTVRRDTGAWFANSASTDAIAITDVGRDCYAADDQTVALTDGAGTRVRAGKIADVHATHGVLVDFTQSGSAGQLVAVQCRIADVSADSSAYAVCPVAGKIVKIISVLEGAITVADATVTCKIGTTAITGGALTIATAGSAAGIVDQVEPTAANTVAVGSFLEADSDGGSTTSAGLVVTFLIAAA
jgi:hypothetical protein